MVYGCVCVFRLELHLVGGFDDDRRTSHSLSLSILGMLCAHTHCVIGNQRCF